MPDSDKPLNPKDEKRLIDRGKGAGIDYKPFIYIHEISSSGESIRAPGKVTGRAHHLLSGIEFAAFMIFDWHEETADIREQYPIPIEDTLLICKQLGIKHPQVSGELTVVTTDILIDLVGGKQLSIAVKPLKELTKPRVRAKLQIEREYWKSKGVSWHIFTEREVSSELRVNLQWLRSVFSDDEPIAEKSEAITLFERLIQYEGWKAVKACAESDDQYGFDPGTSLQSLKRSVAFKFINVPIDRKYQDWTCSDLSLSHRITKMVARNAN